MRVFFVILLIQFMWVVSQGQTWNVTYAQKIKFALSSPEKYSAEALKALEQSFNEKAYYSLLVSNEESLYKALPKIANDQRDGGNSTSFSSGNSFIYMNTKDGVYITEETYPKRFFILDTLQSFQWNLLEEEDELLGYPIKKAFAKTDDYHFIAWYAPTISSKSGPAEYNGLDGLILKIEVHARKREEKVEIFAEKIEQLDVLHNLYPLKKSTKTISRQEFKQLFDDFVRKEDEMLNGGVDVD